MTAKELFDKVEYYAKKGFNDVKIRNGEDVRSVEFVGQKDISTSFMSIVSAVHQLTGCVCADYSALPELKLKAVPSPTVGDLIIMALTCTGGTVYIDVKDSAD